MRTILTVIYLVLLMIASAILIIIDKIKPFDSETVYSFMNKIAKHLDKLSGCNYELHGAENIPDYGVLIVSNHLSFFDPITIVDIFENKPIALIGKVELKKIPTLGYWITKFNCEFIDRDDMKQSIRVIMSATKTLKSGQNVLIFPEGTRAIADEEFKAGSFKIAQNAKADILPITCRGTADVFENNKFLQLKKSKPIITIHPVVKYQDYMEKDIVTLASDIQTIVNSK